MQMLVETKRPKKIKKWSFLQNKSIPKHSSENLPPGRLPWIHKPLSNTALSLKGSIFRQIWFGLLQPNSNAEVTKGYAEQATGKGSPSDTG
jgi:hypothetical protein